MPANLVFRRKIWGARDNGIPPRSTPDKCYITLRVFHIYVEREIHLSGTHFDTCLQDAVLCDKQ